MYFLLILGCNTSEYHSQGGATLLSLNDLRTVNNSFWSQTDRACTR